MNKTPKQIRVIATKIKGSSHEAKNSPCEDFYYYACSGNKLVAVVSDGAGSSRYGKIGAKIVLSGILEEKQQVVIDAFEKNNLKLIEKMQQKEWVAFVVERED